MARHGGGAFSGKDPSKVDRSAAYAARYVAKNIVAAGLADRAEVQVAYAIGVAHPVSVMVETFGTEQVGRATIARARRRALRPAAGRVPRGAQAPPADLPEDRRLRPLRSRRPRLHVGAHRQGRHAARGRRPRAADRLGLEHVAAGPGRGVGSPWSGMTLRRTALVTAVAVAALSTADAAGAKKRCCFALNVVSTAQQQNTWSAEDYKGTDEQYVHWRLRGLFRYREQAGFADLEKASPAHAVSVLTTRSDVTEYINEPGPVAEPDTCGVRTEKSRVDFPRVDLFRGELVMHADDVLNASGCLYGHANNNFETLGTATEGYDPWGLVLPAPARRYFRRGERAIEKHFVKDSAQDTSRDGGHGTNEAVFGEAKIRWFPPGRLDAERRQLRRYHESYRFDDLCDHIPPSQFGGEC